VPWNGSGTTEARPPASSVPPAPHGGLGGLSRHPANSGPAFRSSSYNCRLVIRTDTDFPELTPISRCELTPISPALLLCPKEACHAMSLGRNGQDEDEDQSGAGSVQHRGFLGIGGEIHTLMSSPGPRPRGGMMPRDDTAVVLSHKYRTALTTLLAHPVHRTFNCIGVTSIGYNSTGAKRMGYTRDYIAEKLQSSEKWVARAIVAIYNLQESAERATGITCYLNGRGYNRTDASLMSGYAQQILNGRALSPRQLAVARDILPKYARQLCRIANQAPGTTVN